MASRFTQQLRRLDAMILTAPDDNGQRRTHTIPEVCRAVVLVTDGKGHISERRLRQLMDPSSTANPTADRVTLIARAYAYLARGADPHGQHPSVQSLVNFLLDVNDSPEDPAASPDASVNQPALASNEGDTSRHTDVVSVMGRFWDLDNDARARVEEFLEKEAAQSASRRRGFLRRRGHNDTPNGVGSPPRG